MTNDFLMEARLRELDPALHRKYADCVTVMHVALDRYEKNFPTYSDHSMRHSLDVIEFCNKIIGERNIGLMNAQEIFCLLMAIYLHDFGMGIAEKDFNQIIREITGAPADYENKDIIRQYHQELSARLILKYAPLFDIEGDTQIHAISQIARGHRVTNLLDEAEYPTDYETDDGSKLCLPYLAALIRLADEIDIGRDRNPDSVYDFKSNLHYTEKNIIELTKARAVQTVDVEDDAFVIIVDNADDKVYADLMEDKIKIERTLKQCLDAVNGRTKYRIYQDKLIYKRV